MTSENEREKLAHELNVEFFDKEIDFTSDNIARFILARENTLRECLKKKDEAIEIKDKALEWAIECNSAEHAIRYIKGADEDNCHLKNEGRRCGYVVNQEVFESALSSPGEGGGG